jgi:hypothetical protein
MDNGELLSNRFCQTSRAGGQSLLVKATVRAGLAFRSAEPVVTNLALREIGPEQGHENRGPSRSPTSESSVKFTF